MTSCSSTLFNLMAFVTTLSLAPVAYGQLAPMPAAQQNALVQTYCATCHTDATPIGGLSLERFDAGSVDPGLAAMMASKIGDGAISASGISKPDRGTIDALLAALEAESAGSDKWTTTRTTPFTTGIVAVVPGKPDLYRLKLSCNADTHEAELQLAWAPRDIPGRAVLSTAADGKAALKYDVGQGDGAAKLDATGPLPEKSLTISGVFPNQTVIFPFADLNLATRQKLSACFASPNSR